MLPKERILDELAAWARPGRPELREALASGAAADRLAQWLDAAQDPDLFPEYRQDAPVAAFLADAVLARVFGDPSACGDGYATGSGKAFTDLLSIAYVQNTVLLPPSQRRAAFEERLGQLRALRDAVRMAEAVAAAQARVEHLAPVSSESGIRDSDGKTFVYFEKNPAPAAAPAPLAGCMAGAAPDAISNDEVLEERLFGAAPSAKSRAPADPAVFGRAPDAPIPAPAASRASVPAAPAKASGWGFIRWAGLGVTAFAGLAIVASVVMTSIFPSYEQAPLPSVGTHDQTGTEAPAPVVIVPAPTLTGATAAASGAVSGTGAQEGWMETSRDLLRKMWKDNQAELAVAAGGAFVLFFSSALKEAMNALMVALKGSAAALLGGLGRLLANAVLGAARALARRRHRAGSSDGALFWWAWNVLRPLGAAPLREEVSSALLQVADTLKRDVDFVAAADRRDRGERAARNEAREKLRWLAGGGL